MARTAGSRASWGLLAGLTLLASSQACDAVSTDDTAGTSPLLTEVLGAVGSDVVPPALAEFLSGLDTFEASVEAWLANGGTVEALREAWVPLMETWQRIEVLQIGPLGNSLTTVGGEDLRDEIYSWPSVNTCRVDQETVEAEWDAETWFEDNLVNSYGMDALEHLLFADLDNSCPSQAGIDDDWAALGDSGVQQNRVLFARALVAGLRDQATRLQTAWSSDGGDFSTLLTATTEDTPFSSQQEALNAVFDAMFYLDTSTKDRKLGQPLGLMECSEPRCPEDVEGLASGTGLQNVTANLEGFVTLFTGGTSAGMDDLLADLGHEDLSEDILAASSDAIAAVAALSGRLDELVEESPQEVEALHGAVKAITDLLKTDLATILVLEIPSEAAGDND